MDLFADIHTMLYFLLVLSPLYIPEKYWNYIYWYWIIVISCWAILSKCPLFYLRKTKKDDLIISLEQNGLKDPKNKLSEGLLRLISGVFPMFTIMLLGKYPKKTFIFCIINLSIMYKRCLQELTCMN